VLARLESKFDNFALTASARSHLETTNSGIRAPSNRSSSAPSGQIEGNMIARPSLEVQKRYHHSTVPHTVILWPFIYASLTKDSVEVTSDVQSILQGGTPWFIRQEMANDKALLDSQPGMSAFRMDGRASVCRQPNARVMFSGLDANRIHELCQAYFNSFNVLVPLLDKDVFMAETVHPVFQDGFAEGDPKTVLCLFVVALGEVALQGTFGPPIGMVNSKPSGLRGGSAAKPPGLEIFNEARKRVGFMATETTLINVQIMLLQATYYEATGRHLDFWRSTVSASMACQVLIKCQSMDWQSYYGDMLKRAYWSCVLNEDLYHLDLDLPHTGVQELEDTVPLPYSNKDLESATHQKDDLSSFQHHSQHHFLAMIALRRLIHRIHETIFASTETKDSDDCGEPPVAIIRELAHQLETWHSMLPPPLQWQDSNKLGFPNVDPSGHRSKETLFSSDREHALIAYDYSLDLVTAQLRTRFYYARFLIYRPFVYKALHFPELMTVEDAQCCALAINAALSWPIAMAPPKSKKRLVPHLFAWTQNFMSILLILRMITESDCLAEICEGQVDSHELQESVSLMLEWVRDVRQVDGTASWLWRLLDPLFSDINNNTASGDSHPSKSNREIHKADESAL